MKIQEVSEKYSLSADTLRYYERVGLIPPVTRTMSGIRDYSELDIRRVEFIKCMRSAGLPIEVLIDYMALVQQGDGTIFFFQMVGIAVSPAILGFAQNSAADLEGGLKSVFFVSAIALGLALLLILTIPEISLDAEAGEANASSQSVASTEISLS